MLGSSKAAVGPSVARDDKVTLQCIHLSSLILSIM